MIVMHSIVHKLASVHCKEQFISSVSVSFLFSAIGLGAMQRSQGILPLRFRTGTECTGE